MVFYCNTRGFITLVGNGGVSVERGVGRVEYHGVGADTGAGVVERVVTVGVVETNHAAPLEVGDGGEVVRGGDLAGGGVVGGVVAPSAQTQRGVFEPWKTSMLPSEAGSPMGGVEMPSLTSWVTV